MGTIFVFFQCSFMFIIKFENAFEVSMSKKRGISGGFSWLFLKIGPPFNPNAHPLDLARSIAPQKSLLSPPSNLEKTEANLSSNTTVPKTRNKKDTMSDGKSLSSVAMIWKLQRGMFLVNVITCGLKAETYMRTYPQTNDKVHVTCILHKFTNTHLAYLI